MTTSGVQSFCYTEQIPDEVVGEITRPDCRVALEQALDKKWITPASLDSPVEFELLTVAMQRVELGESACLALAKNRCWRIACDEKKKFLPLAMEWLGQERILGTQGLIFLMIRQGLISVEKADKLLDIWSRNKFRISISSFQDVFE